ncbi:T9SS type A sorting domain-containing protein [Winogradskyella sp. HB-48]|uniref:T9SS type A sorting domain-containing protein n=1 Tax=Winogradskyella sp. HB-48 TaxID=3416808 RepID=UPI003CF76AEC
MKKQLLLFLIIPFLNFGQVQIGQDIDGAFAFDQSGWSVSSSDNGNIIAIGAPGNDGNSPNSGHVRVYENISGNWIQKGNDINGIAENDFFGSAVSLSSNGLILAVGAEGNNGNGNDSGHVRVFEYIGANWTQIGSDINGENINDRFGSFVSLSSDGNIVAAGAKFNDGNGNDSGHVRVYENTGGNWIQIGNDIDGVFTDDEAGSSVSISSDGNIVAVGSPFNDDNGNDSGHVRVYENIGGNWIQIGNNIDGEVVDDNSGWSVSLSANGNIVAIGARYNSDSGYRSGHVRVYENIGGNWIQIGNDIDGEAAGDLSGSSVSLSSDGSIISIGAPFNNIATGHVRIYQNQGGIWVQIGNDIDGEDTFNDFGRSISLSSNGNIITVGGFSNDGNGNQSGHVRVYDLSALLSVEEQKELSFSIYPNPTKNQFTIQLKNQLSLNNINIYNNLGKLVLTSKETIINTSELSSGLYVVEVETTDGKETKKLIIE